MHHTNLDGKPLLLQRRRDALRSFRTCQQVHPCVSVASRYEKCGTQARSAMGSVGERTGVLYAHRILLVSGTNNAYWFWNPRERRCQKHTARPGRVVFNLLAMIRVTIDDSVRRWQLEKEHTTSSLHFKDETLKRYAASANIGERRYHRLSQISRAKR